MLRVLPAGTTCRSVLTRLIPAGESRPEGLLLSLAELSTHSDTGRLGEPRMGGREGAGGVNLPDRECLRGDDFGDTVQVGGWF